jgi:adenosylhomocysteine nucleosidase
LKTVGVVAALSAEARALGRARQHRAESSASFGNLAFLSDGSMLAVSGIGGVAAATAANALIDAGVAALMTFGLAGGLDPTLAPGTVLLPVEVISRDGTRFATARLWRERLSASLSAHCVVSAGVVLTAERSIASPQDKAAAFRDTGAAAVDMESVSVARVAADHQLPFICVRVIVDTAADALPRSVVAASRSGRVQITNLLAGLIVAPADVGALLHLSRRYRCAMRALKVVARSGPLAPLDAEVGLA